MAHRPRTITELLDHRIALALYQTKQVEPNTWAHQFWSQTYEQLTHKKLENRCVLLKESNVYIQTN